VTALTLPSLALAALALGRPSWWPLCLAVAGVAPAGVSLVAGGFGLPVFYFVALFAAAAVALRLMAVTTSLPVRIAGVPGAKPLLAFGIWAAVVTVTAPALFPGMTVLGSAPGNPAMLVPGAVTSSNVAQVAYLWIAIAVIVLLASTRRTHPHVVGVTTVGIVAISFARYVSDKVGLPFPVGLFDNNPGLIYIQTAPGGAERFRGILSEPASLATYCLAAAAFAVAMLPRVATAAKVALVAVLGISVWLGIASTSTTFVVAGSLLCAVGLGGFAWPLVQRRRRIGPAHVVVLLVLLVVGYLAGPALVHYVSDAVTAKSGAESYNERSGADAFSVQVALRSLGFGVGLGANRPSSFAVMLLSNVGVLGLLLFAAAVALIVRHALRCGGAAPTIWVLVAILAAKLVSGPDLADPSGLLYVSLGALAGLRLPSREAPGEPFPHPPSHPAENRTVSYA
jgi:hypothetical protein